MNPNQESSNKLSVPLAILGAGVIIALAIYFRGATNQEAVNNKNQAPSNEPVEKIVLKPISESDYILGNPNAPINIIEYSDTECPFCKRFHLDTFKKVENKYVKNGEVAWIFRHFPLTSIHKNAVKEAEAIQCAGELGGNVKFWSYLDKIFELTKSNDGLDLAELPNIASNLGISKEKFTKCLDSGKYQDLIRSQFDSGVETGVTGTPATFIVLKKPLSKESRDKIYADYKQYIDMGNDNIIKFSGDSKIIRISGAIPFETFSKAIDISLSK
jgi:protein-disulfide isomerase